MSYEVVLLDRYVIRESATKRSLVGRLRKLGEVALDELTDSELASFLLSGARLFNPDFEDWDDISAKIEHGIILWAAMLLTDFRMMASAKYFPIESRVGKTDPSKRVAGNVSIKQELRKQFDAFLNDAGIVLGDQGILVGEFNRLSMATDMIEPYDSQPVPPRTRLKLLAKTAISIDLEWEKPAIFDFAAAVVYYDTKPNLEDKTRLGIDSVDAAYPSNYPKCGVRVDVTESLVIEKQWQNAARIEGLTANTEYYFVCTIIDVNSRVSVSNEISAKTEV